MNHFSVIQIIKTSWTKEHRGGDSASKRNTVPEALQIPFLGHPGEGKLLEHRAAFNEWEGFVKHEKTEVSHPKKPLTLEAIRVQLTENGAEITYRYDGYRVGAPSRTDYPRSFVVKAGEWLHIRYNGRFAWEGAWSYRKVVINVALLEEANPNIFVGMPTKSFSDMANIQ
ncbi:MAG: hypothetical protein SFU83_23170 [Meiothermus sp.]|nr:hypothetical protein [Meiothermus sp.]